MQLCYTCCDLIWSELNIQHCVIYPQTNQKHNSLKDYKPMRVIKTKPLTPATAPVSLPPSTSMTTTGRTSYICQPSDFKCVSHPHTCVAKHMVCDGIHDCTDHSDEFNCTRDQVGSSTSSYKRWKKHYYQHINPGLMRRNKRRFPQQQQHQPRVTQLSRKSGKGGVIESRQRLGWF